MEIKRIALDFEESSGYWKGYQNPYRPNPYRVCQACRIRGNSSGRSEYANKLEDEWCNYSGFSQFSPEQNGMPAAEWQTLYEDIMKNPQYDSPQGRIYAKTNAQAITKRQNSQWKENLNSSEVEALKNAGIINHGTYEARDFLIKRKCLHAHLSYDCSACEGAGLEFRTVEQRTDYLLWEKEEPPAGAGWQLWEDSYIKSPVFSTAEELLNYIIAEYYIREDEY